MLKSLPGINNDDTFKMQPINVYKRELSTNKINDKDFKTTKIDKEKWFKTQRNNFYKEGTIEKIDYGQEVK